MLKRYSEEEYKEIIKRSNSNRDFYINLGGSPNAGSYRSTTNKII